MKVLLDTNIIIHREADRVLNKNIGMLFYWIEKAKHEKWIHPESVSEIEKYKDKEVVRTFKAKIANYNVLHTVSTDTPEIKSIRERYDKNINDRIDTDLLKELFNKRVDVFITEDKKIHNKAKDLGIDLNVYRIDEYIEKITFEYPELIEYPVPSVRKEYFGNINVNQTFFDSFRDDYIGFNEWFNSKAEEIAYISEIDNNIVAFLYLKIEDESENYLNISPVFSPKKRLKVGTFKVVSTGYKLGERFIKIILDNAIINNVFEIYVTIFNKNIGHELLINLLKEWGFKEYGEKHSKSGNELVLTRVLEEMSCRDCKLSFPKIRLDVKSYIVSIYPEYHTSLFPDSILRTESPTDFVEHEPFRNAIQKVYISRSYTRDLCEGDNVVFYMTGGYYKGVISTIGIVQSVIDKIKTESEFIALCRKRSVFSDKELSEHWNYNKSSRPFILNFLCAYSFPHRINMENLIRLGIIKDVRSAPRGFDVLSSTQFETILRETRTDERYIVH